MFNQFVAFLTQDLKGLTFVPSFWGLLEGAHWENSSKPSNDPTNLWDKILDHNHYLIGLNQTKLWWG